MFSSSNCGYPCARHTNRVLFLKTEQWTPQADTRMLRTGLILSAFAGLTLCSGPDETSDTGLEGYDPNLVEKERVACEERGGRFGQGGLAGRFVCFEATRDAGKACRSEADCTTLCLARSRTCAPVTPIFGCQEVLTRSGARSTLCID